jgi:serine/threonine-protein phosphatase 5
MSEETSTESSVPSGVATMEDESSMSSAEAEGPPIEVDRSQDPEAEAKSLELKKKGNDAMTAGRYLEAIRFYSDALEYTPSNAIVRSNRAQAYIKVENYGLAIVDADIAISEDPNYAKGYYRRASAHFALNKFKAARRDFRQVAKLHPQDRDARARLQMCEKAIREDAFAKAIMSEKTIPLSATYNPNVITIDSQYEGPHPHPDGHITDMDAETGLFQPGLLPMEFVMVCGQSLATTLGFTLVLTLYLCYCVLGCS